MADAMMSGQATAASHATINLDVILDVPVMLSLEVGRTRLPIRSLLQLNQGSVVELERAAGVPLDVYVNGTLVAHGQVVVVNEKFGIAPASTSPSRKCAPPRRASCSSCRARWWPDVAVYTEVSDTELEAFLAEYDIGQADSFKGIAEGVENSNYLLTHRRQGASTSSRSTKSASIRSDLPFFLGLMDHLAARGINCPQPIHGRDGNALRTLAGKPAAITSFLHGMWPRRIDGRALRPGRRSAGRPAPRRPGLRAEAAQRAVGRRLAAAVRRLAPPHRRGARSRARRRDRVLRGELAAASCRPASSTPTCSTTMCSSCTTSCRA